MKNVLNFICPTDNLEPTIDRSFNRHNFYCSSLGNSIKFDDEFINYIIGIINENDITTIYFTLSDQNKIIKDAISNQDFLDLEGLSQLFNQLKLMSDNYNRIWDCENLSSLLISNHLNIKIKEIENRIKHKTTKPLFFQGKIYQRNTATFLDIFPETITNARIKLN